MKIILTAGIFFLCLISNFSIKLQSKLENFGDDLLHNYAMFAESIYTPNRHESHPYSEEQIDEDSKSLNMHYGDLLDVFNNNYAADASKQQTQPNLFEKKNLNSEAVALQKKNSFLKNMENSNIVNMNMSFKQNEINDNDGELIKDIKSSLDLKDNINK